MTDHTPQGIVLGIGFGSPIPKDLGVMVVVQVRTRGEGESQEGFMAPIVIARSVLEQLQEGIPQVLAMMREEGIDTTPFPPAKEPIAWNEGPAFEPDEFDQLFLCKGFGFEEAPEGEKGVVALLQVTPIHRPRDEPQGFRYLMDHDTLVAFLDAIPEVLALRWSDVTAPGVAAFDFDRLNFKWDPRTQRVTMNRGYLSEFLRANGVTTLPPMQELTDLLANLYLLHRKRGGPPVAQFDTFLKANGMHIQEHDPATISPARREMDHVMDGLLLRLRTQAREGMTATGFSDWLTDEVEPVRQKAKAAGEVEAFAHRYQELLELAKAAGLTTRH